MMGHFHMKAFHISSANNCVADALSRGQFQKFKELAPEADTFPTAVPMELWSLLNSTLSIYLKIIYLKTHGMYMLMLKNHLKNFEKNYDLEKVWPVPISHLINFIVYLAKNSYSPNTAKSYIAAIGFKMKMNNLTDIYSQKIIERYV
jgi:hypothetical protein